MDANQQNSETLASPENMKYNEAVAMNIRNGISILGGGVAGVLGLTGVYGFLAYFLTYGLIVVLFSLKMNHNTTKYFPSASGLFWDGLWQGLLSYILFWTLMYDIVHIYNV
eukprot:TRINITY_DN601_c0_g1_i1.p1 TRINITY_DN601_c0_g1~~TRINITY_DN601_c0_g1_i1.p1  ORF type:complete len:121 (-),score=20.22 TRINITY_DN601_c0_g1_i1:74-406(-)